jgi:hypothetical protein
MSACRNLLAAFGLGALADFPGALPPSVLPIGEEHGLFAAVHIARSVFRVLPAWWKRNER